MKSTRYTSIFLHGKTFTVDNVSNGKAGIVREMAGLELLIQKGTMEQWAFNRLKELAEKLK